MNIRRIVLLSAAAPVALAAALLLAACGSSDGGGNTGHATSVAGVPDGAPFIDQDNLKFNPTSLTVNAGETVYFKNSETALHTVTVDGKNLSGFMKKDIVFEWTPKDAGEYKITCDLHPQMKATITVE